MKDRPILNLWAIVFGSAFLLACIAACTKSKEDKSGTCNPQYAHVELHGGPEITIELERDRTPDVDPEGPKDPETGEHVVDFDRMV